MEKIKSILKLQSSLLFVLSVVLLFPLIISLIYKEGVNNVICFVYPSLLSLVLALVILIITRKTSIKLNLSGAMAACVISWLVISLIGSIPFVISMKIEYIDALYESVSGYTASGLSVFSNLTNLSRSIIFYRSMIQWIGGLGILTFFLLVTTNTEGEIWKLYGAESHKIGLSRPVPNIYRTIKYLWIIYIFYTALQMVLLKILGVSFFESLIHSFTTISTGGFSSYDNSIAHFAQVGYKNYKIIEYVFILFMFLGGMNFLIHYKILKGNISAFVKNTETRVYVKVIAIATTLIMLAKIFTDKVSSREIEETFRNILFQTVSILTTSGFQTENINSSYYPVVAAQAIIILMIIGGCVGSTSGGFKILRITILNKLFKREIKKIVYPTSAIVPVSVDGSVLEKDEVLRIAGLLFGWIAIIMTGSFITGLFSELKPFEAFSAMVSAVGNVGPMYVNQEKIQASNILVKTIHITGMLVGRLELLPVIVIFSKRTWK